MKASQVKQIRAAFAVLWVMALPLAQAQVGSTGVPIVSATERSAASVAGAALVQLADGSQLRTGGYGAQHRQAVRIDAQGRTTTLPSQMLRGRSGHSATVLADGRVLLLGGSDASGALVSDAEAFDPITRRFQPLAVTGLLSRMNHSATVLTDARVLIVGGIDARGAPVLDAELWNPSTGRVERISARLQAPRSQHTATLLPSGEVLISGGAGTDAESFNPTALRFSVLPAARARSVEQALQGPQAPAVEFSLPAAEARSVPGHQPLVVRFNKRLSAASLNTQSITLIGPNGSETVRAVPAEQGLLLFVWPARDLLPGSRYTLFINGAVDVAHRRLPLTAIGFDTEALVAQAATQSGAAAASAPRAASAPVPARPLIDAQTLAAMEADDELFVPGAEHRKGSWFNGKAHLAADTLPRNALLREKLHGREERQQRLLERRAREQGLGNDASGELKHLGKSAVWQGFKGKDALKTALTSTDPAELRQATGSDRRKVRLTWADVREEHLAESRASRQQAVVSGATALTGQVLRLNGKPLANVTLSVGGVSVRTDAQGEFSLSGIASGSQVLTIDGTSANRANARYGVFHYRTDIPANQTTALPFVIWMPKLDMRHAVKIDSPLKQETIISHPLMPGLEVVLQAGTVVRDAQGKIVTEVSLTPIPVDQAPFPMPYFGVQLHYTLQPGGATLEGVDGKPRAAIVRYPNYTGYGPGTPMNLFDYDPHGRGWYVYAQAQVSAADPTKLVSPAPFQIYQFNATSASSGGPGGDPGAPCNGGGSNPGGGGGGWGQGADGGGEGTCAADPVDLSTGSFVHMERDLMVPDLVPIDFIRFHKSVPVPPPSVSSGSGGGGGGGGGGSVTLPPPMAIKHFYEAHLYMPPPTYSGIQLVLGNGRGVLFKNTAGGACCYVSQTFVAEDDPGEFRGAYMRVTEGALVLFLRDGRRWGFTQYSARLIWMEDANGNRLSVVRPGANTLANRIVSPSGRFVNLSYNANGQLERIEDSAGRAFNYSYGNAIYGFPLDTVTDPMGKTRRYVFSGLSGDGLSSVIDPNGHALFVNEYNGPHRRISRQTMADGSFFTFNYTVDATTLAVQRVDVTDRRGTVRRAEFNDKGDLIRNTQALGLPEEKVTTFEVTNRQVMARTDALNRRTTYEYDSVGNLTRLTRLAGTPDAVSLSATYDGNSSRPLTMTDALNRVTRFGYDLRGNLVTVTDPLEQVTRIDYDPQGKVSSVTSPLQKQTSFTYDGPDLASVTDPLLRQVQYLTDGVGRVMTTVDPLGNRTYNEWDALNRLTRITDPMGGLIRFVYDDNGNITEQIDERGGRTVNAYNNIGKISSITDPLNVAETRTYEPGGKLRRRIDRKGQLAEVTYDALGRTKRIGFGATAAAPTAYQSVIELTWDAGDRLTQVVDKTCANPTTSLNCATAANTSTITRNYDLLDRLTREVTPHAEVNYTYDAANRRSTMLVRNGAPGAQTAQPVITYTWDNGDRLTEIRQAAGAANGNVAQVIGLAYDAAGRRTRTTLSNGSTVNYGYDDADQVTSITYRRADNTVIGDLTYGYDAGGRRTTVGGSLARLNLPSADVTDPTYDAANRLTRWAGRTYTYDLNGSLIGDGVQAYQWNERNQLKGITTGATSMASFQYDAHGRRSGKTVGGATTGFVYDGDNFVQELLGTSNTAGIRAQLLTGGIDETFLRIQGSEHNSVFSDANNNTVRLTNASQGTAVDYTYEPYGATTASAANGNTQQYTGRENDNPGNSQGLYYYRARYYMPGCARFISEDPIGWASGQTNNYGYVGGDPINWTDPSGHGWGWAAIALMGWAVYSTWTNYQDAQALQCANTRAHDAIQRRQELIAIIPQRPMTTAEVEELQLLDRQQGDQMRDVAAKTAEVSKNMVMNGVSGGSGIVRGSARSMGKNVSKQLGTATGMNADCSQ